MVGFERDFPASVPTDRARARFYFAAPGSPPGDQRVAVPTIEHFGPQTKHSIGAAELFAKSGRAMPINSKRRH